MLYYICKIKKGKNPMEINIDKEIDNHRCPEACFCTVPTICYEPIEREYKCYLCWLSYCKEHNITIIYN